MRPAVTRVVGFFNAGVEALATSPRFGPLVGRSITTVTYVGRRSGRTFSTPVSYRRAGAEVVIRVYLPEVKNWWRNFLGGGGPLSLRLDGVERAGHAVAERDGRYRATVTVRLDRNRD